MSRGNEYVLMGYYYDCNYIYGIPVKNRKLSTITSVWQVLNNIFKKAGVALEMFILDNKTSQELINTFDSESITY